MKKMMLTILALVFVHIVPTSAGPSYRQNRYCLHPDESRRWHSSHTIKVRLHNSLLSLCGGDPRSCSTSNADTAKYQIERAVLTALADFNNAGADVRFVFSGWTSSAGLRDHTIVLSHFNAVYDGPCPGGNVGLGLDERQSWFFGDDDRGHVFFCTETTTGLTQASVRLTPWTEDLNGHDKLAPFIKVTRHEILHVLGLQHPDKCHVDTDAVDSTVMLPGGTFMNLGREDIRFLRDHFGARENEGDMSVSQNGMTWRIANGSAPPEAARSMGRPAATNSGEGRNLYVAWRDTSEDRITVTRYAANDSWSVVSSVQARNAPYAPGIAYADDRHLLLAYQRHSAGLSSRDMYPVVRASSNSGATWTSEFVLDGLSYISGISATHDPASGEWLLFTGGPSVEGRGNESGIFLCGTAISRTTCRNPG